MKAIIPAAGIGTRLRPHTYTLPKALLYVAGKPIIAHILDDVVPLAPSSIVLIVGYKGELIEQYVRKQYPKLTVDFVYQEERRGIGHAVDLTRKVADRGEPLLIVLGDTNSCLVAIAAKRRKVPVFHMEAGNRCFDERVPEEINRRIVDHVSDINLVYTEHARRYLHAEGIAPDRVIKTGSPMKEHSSAGRTATTPSARRRGRRFSPVSTHPYTAAGPSAFSSTSALSPSGTCLGPRDSSPAWWARRTSSP